MYMKILKLTKYVLWSMLGLLFCFFFFPRFLVRSTFRVFLRMLNTLILILKNKLLEHLRQLRVADVMVAEGTNRDF